VAESDQKIGITGAVNFRYDQPDEAFLTGTNFNWWTGFTKKQPIEAITEGRLKEPQESLSVPGSSLLIKKEVIDRIGVLDSRFFIYYEESDWCARAIKAGYKVYFVPKAKIAHKVSVTFGNKTPKGHYLYTRNLALFMVKNNKLLPLVTFFVFYLCKIFLRVILFYFTGKKRESRAIMMGLTDFLKHNFERGRLDEV